MPNTPRWAIPYAGPGDAPNGYGQEENIANATEAALNVVAGGVFATAVSDGTPHLLGDSSTTLQTTPIGVWTKRRISAGGGLTITTAGIRIGLTGTYEAACGCSVDATGGAVGRCGIWPTVNGISVPTDSRCIVARAARGTSPRCAGVQLDLVVGDVVSALAYQDSGQNVNYAWANLSVNLIGQ